MSRPLASQLPTFQEQLDKQCEQIKALTQAVANITLQLSKQKPDEQPKKPGRPKKTE